MVVKTDVQISFDNNTEYKEAQKFRTSQNEYKLLSETTVSTIFGKTMFSVIDAKDVGILLSNKNK